MNIVQIFSREKEESNKLQKLMKHIKKLILKELWLTLFFPVVEIPAASVAFWFVWWVTSYWGRLVVTTEMMSFILYKYYF